MSDNEEPVKNIAQVKKDKKELKKKINPEVSKIRSENMKKALAKKKENFENKNKLKVVEYNISDLLNNNNESSDEEVVEVKKIKNNQIQPTIDNLNNEYKTVLDSIMNNMNSIQKRVEKMYIMKKNKPPKPLPQQIPIYTKNNNSSSDDLLNAIKNKMLNN